MKSERVRQLDAEIDWRINNRRVLDALRDNNGKFVANRPLTSRETDQAFAALTKPFEDEYALYDQFARRNLFSLMHELASLLPEPSKDCVRRASYKLERIRIPESPDEPITPKLFIVRMNEVGDLRWHEFPHKFASDGRSQGIDRAKIDALKNMGCERSEG